MWPQWTNMLSWWQWGLLAAVPPAIVALYFLKLRRRPLQVPSTYLWHKSLEDLHVNSLWQRLRQNLLMFLQLLVIALAMLALLRPSWQGTRLLGDRFVFLVDTSASMAARDVDPSRLHEAKRQIERIIDQMRSTDTAMIVSFSDRARVEQPFTSDRRALKSRLAAIEQTPKTTSLDEALRVAAGLANPSRSGDISDTQISEAIPAKLYVFSDGRFDRVTDFALGNLDPVFVRIGNQQAANVGITAFSTVSTDEQPDEMQVFGRLVNFGQSDATVEAELFVNGEMVDADEVQIEAGEEQGVLFELERLDSAELELRLSSDDDLELDNRAFLAVNPRRRARVLCATPGNEPLELVLTTERATRTAEIEFAEPAYLEGEEFAQRSVGGEFDLVIFDRCAPVEPPQSNTLYIGALPPSEDWAAAETVDIPVVIDVESAHPLMNLVVLGDVQILEAKPLIPPPGHTALVESHVGTILAIAPRDAFEDAALAFELVGEEGAQTTWPLRASFPVFMLNTLRYLGRASDESASESFRPGQAIVFRDTAGGQDVHVETPSAEHLDLRRDASQLVNFSGTDELGIYRFEVGPDIRRRLAVNLFDRMESNIRPAEDGSIQIGHVTVEGSAASEAARRDYWKPILLVALAVLLMEWYIYNRRVYL